MPDRVNQFITTRQSSNETGATFFYRITNLHAQSGMLLDEDSLMTLIVDHMQPHYQEYFRYKKFASLKALKDALVMFDRRRRDILLTREAEVGGKRKSTLAAILDMDSEDVNLRLARHLPAIQEESEPTTEPMKKMLQKMEQIEAKINSLQSYPERQRQTQPRNQDNQQSRRPQQYGSQDRKTIECYNCHRFGHYRRECYREGGGAYLSRVPQQPQQGNYRNDRWHQQDSRGGDRGRSPANNQTRRALPGTTPILNSGNEREQGN